MDIVLLNLRQSAGKGPMLRKIVKYPMNVLFLVRIKRGFGSRDLCVIYTVVYFVFINEA